MLAERSFPWHDIFSHTAAGQPWVNMEWLAQIILASTYDWFGWRGLIVLGGLVVALTFVLVYKLLARGLRATVALSAAAISFLFASRLSIVYVGLGTALCVAGLIVVALARWKANHGLKAIFPTRHRGWSTAAPYGPTGEAGSKSKAPPSRQRRHLTNQHGGEVGWLAAHRGAVRQRREDAPCRDSGGEREPLALLSTGTGSSAPASPRLALVAAAI
jgi:hypothetical protein